MKGTHDGYTQHGGVLTTCSSLTLRLDGEGAGGLRRQGFSTVRSSPSLHDAVKCVMGVCPCAGVSLSVVFNFHGLFN